MIPLHETASTNRHGDQSAVRYENLASITGAANYNDLQRQSAAAVGAVGAVDTDEPFARYELLLNDRGRSSLDQHSYETFIGNRPTCN